MLERFLIAGLALLITDRSHKSENNETPIATETGANHTEAAYTNSNMTAVTVTGEEIDGIKSAAVFHEVLLGISLIVCLAYGGLIAYSYWANKDDILGHIRNLVIALFCRIFFTILYDGVVILGTDASVGGRNALAAFECISQNLVFAFWLMLTVYLHARVERTFNSEPTLKLFEYGIPGVAVFFALVSICALPGEFHTSIEFFFLSPLPLWLSASLRLLYLLIQLALVADMGRMMMKTSLDNDSVSLLKKLSAIVGVLVLLFWLQFGLSIARLPLQAASYYYFDFLVDGSQGALVCSALFFLHKWVPTFLDRIPSFATGSEEMPKQTDEALLTTGRGVLTVDSLLTKEEGKPRGNDPATESTDVVYSSVVEPHRLQKTLEMYKRLNVLPKNQSTVVEGEEFFDCITRVSIESEIGNSDRAEFQSITSENSKPQSARKTSGLFKMSKTNENIQKKNAFYASKYLILDSKESIKPKYLETRPSVSSGKERIGEAGIDAVRSSDIVTKWLDDHSENLRRVATPTPRQEPGRNESNQAPPELNNGELTPSKALPSDDTPNHSPKTPVMIKDNEQFPETKPYSGVHSGEPTCGGSDGEIKPDSHTGTDIKKSTDNTQEITNEGSRKEQTAPSATAHSTAESTKPLTEVSPMGTNVSTENVFSLHRELPEETGKALMEPGETSPDSQMSAEQCRKYSQQQERHQQRQQDFQLLMEPEESSSDSEMSRKRIKYSQPEETQQQQQEHFELLMEPAKNLREPGETSPDSETSAEERKYAQLQEPHQQREQQVELPSETRQQQQQHFELLMEPAKTLMEPGESSTDSELSLERSKYAKPQETHPQQQQQLLIAPPKASSDSEMSVEEIKYAQLQEPRQQREQQEEIPSETRQQQQQHFELLIGPAKTLIEPSESSTDSEMSAEQCRKYSQQQERHQQRQQDFQLLMEPEESSSDSEMSRKRIKYSQPEETQQQQQEHFELLMEPAKNLREPGETSPDSETSAEERKYAQLQESHQQREQQVELPSETRQQQQQHFELLMEPAKTLMEPGESSTDSELSLERSKYAKPQETHPQQQQQLLIAPPKASSDSEMSVEEIKYAQLQEPRQQREQQVEIPSETRQQQQQHFELLIEPAKTLIEPGETSPDSETSAEERKYAQLQEPHQQREQQVEIPSETRQQQQQHFELLMELEESSSDSEMSRKRIKYSQPEETQQQQQEHFELLMEPAKSLSEPESYLITVGDFSSNQGTFLERQSLVLPTGVTKTLPEADDSSLESYTSIEEPLVLVPAEPAKTLTKPEEWSSDLEFDIERIDDAQRQQPRELSEGHIEVLMEADDSSLDSYASVERPDFSPVQKPSDRPPAFSQPVNTWMKPAEWSSDSEFDAEKIDRRVRERRKHSSEPENPSDSESSIFSISDYYNSLKKFEERVGGSYHPFVSGRKKY